ncbi:MAG: TIR domain-containing protein [Bacteroidia bacterium]|nr:TIR domain-containing protein [Bacteroidia bacterium]
METYSREGLSASPQYAHLKMAKSPENHYPFDVFLSHSSKDKPLLRPLAVRLRDQEGLRCWYDEWNLQPGLPWQEALEKGLADSASVTVFIGPEKLGPWHNEELREAINRSVSQNDGFRVIPVLLPGADPDTLPTFLKRRMWVDFRTGMDDDIAYKKLTAAIRGEAFEESAFTLPEDRRPFRGLAPYEEGEAEFFFGRKSETSLLLDRVEANGITLLHGPSGSGKTSLVQAGLIPALKEEAQTSHWQIHTFRPGSDPFHNLAGMVLKMDPNPADKLTRIEKTRQLAETMSQSATGLRNAISAFSGDQNACHFIVIDQLEEIFMLVQKAFPEKHATILQKFGENIREALTLGDGKIRFLAVLRSDFLGDLEMWPWGPELLKENHQLALTEPGRESLMEFVQQSAFVAGAFFEKGLVNTLIRAVEDQACKYSLLQVELSKLWEARKGPWLTVDAFETGGGIERSVTDRANHFVQRVRETGRSGYMQFIWMNLIKPGEGFLDQRRAAEMESFHLDGADREVLRNLIWLLSGPEFRLAEATRETLLLCHDCLVRSWEISHEFIQNHRQSLRMIMRISESSQNWSSQGNNADFLFKGAQLMEYEELSKMEGTRALALSDLPPREKAFITESLAERDRQKQKKQVLRISVFATITVVLLTFMGLLIKVSQEKSHSEANKAVSLAISASELYAQQPSLAFNLAEESIRLFPDSVRNRKAYDALLNSYFHSPFNFTLSGHKQGIHGGKLVISPDGNFLLTNTFDHKAILWTDTGDSIREFSHRDHINQVAFSPDSLHLLTASADSTCKIWTLDGKLVTEWNPGGPVINAFFSPGGKEVITMTGTQEISKAGDSLTVCLWRIGEKEQLFHRVYRANPQGAYSVGLDFSFGKKHFVFTLDYSDPQKEDFSQLLTLDGRLDTVIPPGLKPQFCQSSDLVYTAIFYHEDGRGKIGLYNHTEQSLNSLEIDLGSNYMKSFRFSSDNQFLIIHTGFDHGLDRVFEVKTGQEVHLKDILTSDKTNQKLQKNIQKIQDDHLFIQIADIDHGLVYILVAGRMQTDGTLRFRGVGTFTLKGRGGTPIILPDGKDIAYFNQFGSYIFLSPDPRKELYVFSRSGQLIYHLLENGNSLAARKSRELATSSKGMYLYQVLVTGEIQIWPILVEQTANVFQSQSRTRDFDLSPEGTEIALGGNFGEFSLWDEPRKLKRQFPRQGEVWETTSSIAYSPKGARPLAWVSRDSLFMLMPGQTRPRVLWANPPPRALGK